MTPGLLHGIPDDQNLEKQIEKQMGCMAGFLQLFDRHQILVGKRLYTTKRLPSSPAVDSDKSVVSPAFSRDLLDQQPQLRSPSPGTRSPGPVTLKQPEIPARSPSPLPLPVFDLKDGLRSSWKLRESPRLSLDSRATVDGKGSLYPREIRTNSAIFSGNRCENAADENSDKDRRSPSVVARLMGLEALPEVGGGDSFKKAELRRSASESRVSRDLLQYRFIDGNNFQIKQLHQQQPNSEHNAKTKENAVIDDRSRARMRPDSVQFCGRKSATFDSSKGPNGGFANSQRKSFFDSEDFFPEPKRTGSLYGEIEKRLKMRGIDEPSKDLETLKQILEALQLKGLLHCKKPEEKISHRNFICDRSFFSYEENNAPIVVMKPVKSPASVNRARRAGNESPPSNSRSKVGVRRNLVGEALPPVRPRRDPPVVNRSSAKSPSSLERRRSLTIETQKQTKDSCDRKSPKTGGKKTVSDVATSRSPRNRKTLASETSPKTRISSPMVDEFSTVSESSRSASSQIDSESHRSKTEDYREGRSLLERCDKLLNSIAEFTATEPQPSPVSVLDSSFYKDDASPSPVLNRCIQFKDQFAEQEDDQWSPLISPVRSKYDDPEFLYVSEILRFSNTFETLQRSHTRTPSGDSDVFLLLEKQQCTTKSSSTKYSKLHRKLVFDTVTEILDQKRHVSPWKAFSGVKSVTGAPSLLRQVLSKLQRIQERPPAEGIFEIVCGLLEKDMVGDAVDGWGDHSVEMSEAVLDIERLIFKDLVADTIRDLAVYGRKCEAPVPRRKLVF